MTRLAHAALATLALIGGAATMHLSSIAHPGVFAAAAAEADDSLVKEMALGDPDAPVTMIEYASFTCPHCKSFHEGPMKRIKADYVDTGKVQFILREVYLSRPALWAGMVARCGGEDRYFGIVDMIFEKQSDWSGASTPEEVAEGLRRIGRIAGLTDDDLDACLSDVEKAEALVSVSEGHRVADDVRGTPSFVINGEKYSNSSDMTYEKFAEILDEKLEE